MARHIIEGHAIVSAEGGIADADGVMPDCLKIEADWRYFQRQLDDSDLTVLGRLSHEAAVNPGRRRLVITSAVTELARLDPLTWRLNPSATPMRAALDELCPGGGRIAVVGGRSVFDLFLAYGLDAFHLTIAPHCHVQGAIPVFSGVSSAEGALCRLGEQGLDITERKVLDQPTGAELYVFTKR